MKCELLKIQQVIGEVTVQATISETLRVPEEKPGVEQVVSADGTVRIRRIEIIEDKIIVHGRLHVGVVYVAFKDPQPVHYTHEGIEFTQFADLPGALPGMTARVRARILDIQGECGDGRGFGPDQYGIIAVLEIIAKVTQTQEVNVLVEPDPGVQATTQQVRVEEIVAEASQQSIVEGRFRVPEEKPGVDRILDVAAEIFITESKIVDGQALIEGEAILQFMYVAFKDSQPVHHMHHRLHFTQFVPLPDLHPMPHHHKHLHVNVDNMIEYIGFDSHSPDTVKAELFLAMNVIITRSRDIDVVTAITDITAPNYQTACLNLEQVIGEANTQALVKEEIRIPDEKPGAQQVLDVKIVRVHIPHEEIVVINDKVILSGIIIIKVIYVAFIENQPVHAVEAKIKFRSFIPIPGCLPDMTALVNAVVEHATAFTHEPDKITAEIILQLTGRVVQTVQIYVVLCPTAPVAPPTAPPPPTACPTTVTVQAGDTIFKYAMQYHVSMDHIIAANPGIDPNNLVVGSTITIPCDP